MSTSKHSASGHAPTTTTRDNLKDSPGISASRGTTIAGEDPHILTDDGDDTEQGDVENNADATGAPTRQDRHRTNK